MLNLLEFRTNISYMSAKKTGIGERIRETRLKMALSQEKFAALVESSKSSISGYETEDVPVPADVLRNISLKCKVSADWLLTGENPEIVKDANERHLIEAFREAGKYPEHREQEGIIKYADWRIRECRAAYGKEKGVQPDKGKTPRHKTGSG
ncbi:MAG: XRE family transcriptional regulator [Nitrospirae bacterium]|nr:MAG: XRE family transcriptional regulator [Nitrospirota bacterium]